MQDEIHPDARLALQRGNLIEAIKIVRDRTGLGLKEAKELVDRHADRVAAEPVPPADDFSQLLAGGPPRLPAEAVAALAEGRKIEAIRIAREATGLGLKEAKELVERHEARPAGGIASDPMAEPGRVTGGGSRTWLAIVVVLVLLAGLFILFSGA
ncbi:ribosomal protein L7/L12 [Variovorax sp. TBS-050B]|uniref:ribosomal protein L7/L12 n=1 Tax=Variovorax sp. TBS-050B TaxID=2940551 RepID=UPI0024764CCD|nr:ribosomal protein L7/L12 [Variovorax sp. TBS-050B]MDH6594810.1 ribosomal protein L7/L12 [Variovorax sp. TBS-050B]